MPPRFSAINGQFLPLLSERSIMLRPLVATFHPARGRVPSEVTLRRAVRYVDRAQREYALTALPELPPVSGVPHVAYNRKLMK